MKKFQDAIVWQKSYKLVLLLYEMTAHFPKYEEFGLKSSCDVQEFL
jgi:hypothetical protein